MDGINLFVLRHQADGSVKADRMENKKWEGWQMEEILQETMDIEDGYTSEPYSVCTGTALLKSDAYNAIRKKLSAKGLWTSELKHLEETIECSLGLR